MVAAAQATREWSVLRHQNHGQLRNPTAAVSLSMPLCTARDLKALLHYISVIAKPPETSEMQNVYIQPRHLEQTCPIPFSVTTKIFLLELSDTGATRHVWL